MYGNEMIYTCLWVGYGTEEFLISDLEKGRRRPITMLSIDALDYPYQRMYEKIMLFDLFRLSRSTVFVYNQNKKIDLPFPLCISI